MHLGNIFKHLHPHTGLPAATPDIEVRYRRYHQENTCLCTSHVLAIFSASRLTMYAQHLASQAAEEHMRNEQKRAPLSGSQGKFHKPTYQNGVVSGTGTKTKHLGKAMVWRITIVPCQRDSACTSGCGRLSAGSVPRFHVYWFLSHLPLNYTLHILMYVHFMCRHVWVIV